jgi:DNA transposition AAA+ family ATPase
MEAAKVWNADKRTELVSQKLGDMRSNGVPVGDGGGELRRITFADVAEATGVSRSAISTMVNKGLSVNDDAMQRIIDFIRTYDAEFMAGNAGSAEEGWTEETAHEAQDTESSRQYKRSIELYRTKEFSQALGWCGYIQARRRMGVMIGYPGSGKTTILREFCRMNAEAHYIECWPMMRVGDLMSQLAGAAGISVSGNSYARAQQIMQALGHKNDVTLVFDEAEYLRTWDVTKFEVLRKIWDNTGTPVIMAGTPELESILTRGSGRENLAQLYRRKYEIKLSGIQASEVKSILKDYNISDDAAAELSRIATDARHGGMGNFVEILDICLDAAGDGQIDMGILSGAKQYKLMY